MSAASALLRRKNCREERSFTPLVSSTSTPIQWAVLISILVVVVAPSENLFHEKKKEEEEKN